MEQNRTDKKIRNRRVILDVFVILLLAVSVAGVVFRCFFYERIAKTDRSQRVKITFEVVDVYAPVVENLHEGDSVYLEADGTRRGVLLSDAKESVITNEETVQTDAAQQEGETETKDPYRKTDATGTIVTVEGKALNNSFLFDGKTVLAIGDEVKLYTDRAVFYAVIMGIEEAE